MFPVFEVLCFFKAWEMTGDEGKNGKNSEEGMDFNSGQHCFMHMTDITDILDDKYIMYIHKYHQYHNLHKQKHLDVTCIS